jgi:hypothetical protein
MLERINKKPVVVECSIEKIMGEKIVKPFYDASKNEYFSLPNNVVLPSYYIARNNDGKRVVIWEIEFSNLKLNLKVGQKVKIHREPFFGIIYRDFVESSEGSLTHVMASFS